MNNFDRTNWVKQMQPTAGFAASENIIKTVKCFNEDWLGDSALESFKSMNKNWETILGGVSARAINVSSATESVQRSFGRSRFLLEPGSALSEVIRRSGNLGRLPSSMGDGLLSSHIVAKNLTKGFNWESLISAHALIQKSLVVDPWPEVIRDFVSLSDTVSSMQLAVQSKMNLHRSFDMFDSVKRYVDSLSESPQLIERQMVLLGTNVALGTLEFQTAQTVGIDPDFDSLTSEESEQFHHFLNDLGLWEIEAIQLCKQASPKAAEQLLGAYEALSSEFGLPGKVAHCLVEGIDSLLDHVAPVAQVNMWLESIDSNRRQVIFDTDVNFQDKASLVEKRLWYLACSSHPGESTELALSLAKASIRNLAKTRRVLEKVKHSEWDATQLQMKAYIGVVLNLTVLLIVNRER